MLSKSIQLLGFLATPGITWACAVCFGDPNSTLTHASTLGILTLLGITWVVLGAFAAFFIHLKKRSKLANRHERNGQVFHD